MEEEGSDIEEVREEEEKWEVWRDKGEKEVR
jgi:hypothetical protein